MIKNKSNSEFYKWGNNCDSWVLLENQNLAVKQEIIPSNSGEKLHYHQKSQQFFFILRGTATFYCGENIFEVKENEGFSVAPKQKHRIENNASENLEIIVISNPSTKEDRFEVL